MSRRTARRSGKRSRRVALLGLFAVLLVTRAADLTSPGSSIGGYQLVSQQPQKNTTLFTYRATLTNGGAALSSATATAKSMAGAIKLVDNALSFGRVAAGGSVVSTDTFSFTRNGNNPP